MASDPGSEERLPSSEAWFGRPWVGRVLPWVLIGLALVVAAGVGVARGQDSNYDQVHAHYYGLYWFFHHRERVDFFPAGLGGVIPFFWDLPWYFLVTKVDPRITAGALGAEGGLAVVFVAVLGWRIVRLRSSRRGAETLLVAAMTIFGATGAGFLGEFGTTFGDVATAIPFLAGLIIILWTGTVSTSRNALFFGMLLVGVSVGLKLTNVPWAAASALGLVAAVRGRDRVRLLLPALGGMAVGFAVVYGPWAIAMYRYFDSPMFPLFNSIFHSPDYISSNFRDTRWVLKSPVEIFTLPFTWLAKSHRTGEATMRDWRWFALLVAALIYLLARLAPIVRNGTRPAGDRRFETDSRLPDEPLIARDTRRFLITFVLGGLVLSLVQLAYTRYLVIGELTAGLALVCLLDATPIWRPFHIRRAAVVTAIALILTSSTTSWGTVPFGKSWYRVHIPNPPRNALILVVAAQTYQYVLPFFPSSDRFGAIDHNNPTFATAYKKFTEEVRAFNGPIELLSPDTTEAQLGSSAIGSMRSLGLRLSPGPCSQIAALTGPLQLCPLSRTR